MSMFSQINVEAIFRELMAGRVIHIEDRSTIGIANTSIEEVLDSIVRIESMLFHGTDQIIPCGTPLRLSPGRERNGICRDMEGFATDLPAIAILKALFSNKGKGVNLRYPMVVSAESPLKLTIVGWRIDVERSRGYVHLIGPRDRFEREGNTWQWVTSQVNVKFAGCVEVEKSDFRYPVNQQ